MRSHANKAIILALALAGIGLTGTASATLMPFQTYTGHVGYSSDGFGSVTQTGNIRARVPVGSTVLAAYLYSATFNATDVAGGTLNGSTVNYGTSVVNSDACCDIASQRADVTSIVKPLIDGGPGGIYSFPITETSGYQDGEALVVIYSNPLLPTATFGMLDGFARTSGDTTMINFAQPLDPGDPGFFAEMFLGDGFSCCDQESTITVNGITITNSAGNNDDSIDASAQDGNLITVGSFDDPYSPLLPTYDQDHERYDLVPYITAGDTSITVNTFNSSRDDNIFLAGFYVSGLAGINAPPTGVPEPDNLGLFGLGVAALILGLAPKRRRRTGA
ncbi:PEP-CTERM sorting domain-containing protein [Rhodanobacter lindaniclasticus]